MKINLGFKNDSSVMAQAPESPVNKDAKIFYPNLTIPNQKELTNSLKVGQEVTATVKLKVVSKTEREKGRQYEPDECRVEFDVLSMEPQGLKMPEGEPEKDGRQALSEYLAGKKRMPKSAPPDEDEGEDY